MKPYFLLIVLFLSNLIFAQQPPNERIAGLVRGQAIRLAKPAYPPEAKARRIRGKVTVNITIDEAGKVVSAKAATGNSVFHPAAEEAAMQSTFTPTSLNGQPIKVTANMVFNFVKYIDWEMVGSVLAGMQSNRASVTADKSVLSDPLWDGFEKEKAEYDALRRSEAVPDLSRRATRLIETLRSKLKSQEPTELWYFNVGYTTELMGENAVNKEETVYFYRYLEEFARLVDNAPPDIPAERMDVFVKVAKYRSLRNLDKDQRVGIINLLTNSRNSFINLNQ